MAGMKTHSESELSVVSCLRYVGAQLAPDPENTITYFQCVAIGDGDHPHTSGFTTVNKAELHSSQHYSEQDKCGHESRRKVLCADCFCAADWRVRQLDSPEPYFAALKLSNIL